MTSQHSSLDPSDTGEARGRQHALARFVTRVAWAAASAASDVEAARAVCTSAVDDARFQMAWVGVVTAEQLVLPIAYAGIEAGYLPSVRITAADQREGRGPTGRAIRTGSLQVCDDISGDPLMAPWREQAALRDFRSSAAAPIRRGGAVVGALTVYADLPAAFDAAAVHALTDAADALSEVFERSPG